QCPPARHTRSNPWTTRNPSRAVPYMRSPSHPATNKTPPPRQTASSDNLHPRLSSNQSALPPVPCLLSSVPSRHLNRGLRTCLGGNPLPSSQTHDSASHPSTCPNAESATARTSSPSSDSPLSPCRASPSPSDRRRGKPPR